MTIFNITVKLSEYFAKKDSFFLHQTAQKAKKDNFKDIFLVTDDEEKDRAALRLALEELEKSGFISSIKEQDKIWWILRRNLDSYSQTIQISPETASIISKIINEFSEKTENQSISCNPLNLQDRDIQCLASIILSLLGEKN